MSMAPQLAANIVARAALVKSDSACRGASGGPVISSVLPDNFLRHVLITLLTALAAARSVAGLVPPNRCERKDQYDETQTQSGFPFGGLGQHSRAGEQLESSRRHLRRQLRIQDDREAQAGCGFQFDGARRESRSETNPRSLGAPARGSKKGGVWNLEKRRGGRLGSPSPKVAFRWSGLGVTGPGVIHPSFPLRGRWERPVPSDKLGPFLPIYPTGGSLERDPLHQLCTSHAQSAGAATEIHAMCFQ